MVIADLRFYPDGDIDCPEHDSGAAIQNILLGCHYHDIGACYVSSQAINSNSNRKLLNIEEYEKITAFIWLGRFEKMPLMPERKPAKELYRFI